MKFLDNIREKTIIVCPSTIKNKVLKEINKKNRLINVKIYSLDELKRLTLFDYDISAILYLIDKYDLSYDTAKYYLENLYYIEDKEYNNEKLDYLVSLKRELLDNNLLVFNNMFKSSYKNTKFIVFGYDYIDTFNEKILKNYDYKIEKENVLERKNKVYKFNTLEEEVLFVINKIIELINKGVELNNIYLLNLDNNYKEEVLRLFNMFNIPIDINNNSAIISSVIGKDIFNKLEECKSFSDTVSYMDSLNINVNNQVLYDKVIKIFNKYIGLDYSFTSILKCVKYDFENTILNLNTLKYSIKTGDLYNDSYNDDDYIFLLGFNQGSIPNVFKDEDYISDDLKEILGLDSTLTINKKRIESTKNNINRINHLTISYKKHYMNDEFYPSSLLSDKNEFVLEDGPSLKTENSSAYSNIRYAKMLDNLINYDENNVELSKYYNSIKDLRYMEYDNKYKQINKNDLKDFIKKSKTGYLSLSYSSINEFFKCQFRYYITRVLSLNKYDDSFDLFIGDLFHYVLSKLDNKASFDFDKEYESFIKDKDFSAKELFYINKLKKELKIICDYVNKFHDETELSEILTEEPMKVDKSKDDLKIVFNGTIDKIMCLEDKGETLCAVIDYKTGNESIKLDYLPDGIGLQLLMYLYLIAKDEDNKINNPYFVGFYIQNILNKIETKPKEKKTYLDKKNKSLQLVGYSISDESIVGKFDPTEKSNYIMSLTDSRLLDEDTMNNIVDFVDEKINFARDKIIDADFTINPKYDYNEDESVGCKNCKYKDICFMKNENFVPIEKNKSFDFLKEGENDA